MAEKERALIMRGYLQTGHPEVVRMAERRGIRVLSPVENMAGFWWDDVGFWSSEGEGEDFMQRLRPDGVLTILDDVRDVELWIVAGADAVMRHKAGI